VKGKRKLIFRPCHKIFSVLVKSTIYGFLINLQVSAHVSHHGALGLSASKTCTAAFHLRFGISLIWVFSSFVPFAMLFCMKETRFISPSWHGGCWAAGCLPPCAQIGRSQTLVGSCNHNLSHAWHGRPGASQAIRIQKDWTRKRSPLASRIWSRETGCQV
jgi:hypothetical protein